MSIIGTILDYLDIFGIREHDRKRREVDIYLMSRMPTLEQHNKNVMREIEKKRKDKEVILSEEQIKKIAELIGKKVEELKGVNLESREMQLMREFINVEEYKKYCDEKLRPTEETKSITKNLDYLENFYFEPTQTVYEKVGKLKEEYKEVIEAYEMSLEGKKTNSDVAQEILDTIHASINLLRKMDEEELITIETEIFKHSVKLGEYLESGKYKIKR